MYTWHRPGRATMELPVHKDFEEVALCGEGLHSWLHCLPG